MSTVEIINKGNSLVRMDLDERTGLVTAVKPKMSAILAMLEPTTLPIAISAVAPGATVSDATKLTASSGNDVPKATSVKPITSGDTLNFLAIDADDETKGSLCSRNLRIRFRYH